MNFEEYNNARINILCKLCSKDFIGHPNSTLCSKYCRWKAHAISCDKWNDKVRQRIYHENFLRTLSMSNK